MTFACLREVCISYLMGSLVGSMVLCALVGRGHARQPVRCAALVGPECVEEDFRDLVMYSTFRAAGYVHREVVRELESPPWTYATGTPEELRTHVEAIEAAEWEAITDLLAEQIKSCLESGVGIKGRRAW